MILTRKSLSRRSVLRGVGATIALPLLDSMVPAHTALRATAANPVRRFGAIYVPMGANMDLWTPKTDGALKVSAILEPLARFQDRMVVVTGLDSMRAIGGATGAAVHSTVQGSWLTAAAAKSEGEGDGSGIRAGVSMDQIIARELENETQLASLEIGLEPAVVTGRCELNYSCIYSSVLSWRTAETPLPAEHLPRALFERLFGVADSTDQKSRMAYLRRNRSILDAVSRAAADFKARIGPADARKVSEYLDAVRDVERRLQRAEEQSDKELPVVGQPEGVPAKYEEYATLMFDLLLLAYQTDLTRVATVMMGREMSLRTYTEIGLSEPHHPISHHQDNPEKLAQQAKLNTFHIRLFSGLLERMQATPDGDGSLLDHTLFFYGSGMSNSNTHTARSLPALVVGSRTFQINGGQHLRFPRGTSLANLQLALMNRMGIRPVVSFGDSTGELPGV